MDDVLRVSLLLDFYGSLLTETQSEILRMHYEEDLSLGEIAEQRGVTRAAVHDAERRGLNLLEQYESKLALVHKHMDQTEKLRQISVLLKSALDILEELKT